MKRLLITALLPILLCACVKFGRTVNPVLQARANFANSVSLANRTLGGLYLGIQQRVEKDCPTLDDTSVLCTRTLDQSERLIAKLDEVAALVDKAVESYSRALDGAQAESLLDVVLRAVLDVARLSDALGIGPGEELPEGLFGSNEKGRVVLEEQVLVFDGYVHYDGSCCQCDSELVDEWLLGLGIGPEEELPGGGI